MGVCNVYQYQNVKTIKLSDSYKVTITLSDADVEKIGPFLEQYPWFNGETKTIELPECLSVTLPEISLKEEVYSYGNNKRLFLIPDYDKPTDLKIELMEHYNASNIFAGTEPNEFIVPTGVIELLVNLFTSKLFDSVKFAYLLNDYIPELEITIFRNSFRYKVFKYKFTELKLTDYTKYQLDYSAANACKWSLSFSFRSYEGITAIEGAAEDDPIIDPRALGLTTAPIDNVTPIEDPGDTQTPDDTAGGTNAVDPASSGDGTEAPAGGGEPDAPTTPLESDINSADGSSGVDPATPGTPEVGNEPGSALTADGAAGAEGVAVPEPKSESDIDELAYQMMRGNLGNGQARKDAAKELGFSEEETQAAQDIVNQKDWAGLRERHNQRESAAQQEAIAPATPDGGDGTTGSGTTGSANPADELPELEEIDPPSQMGEDLHLRERAELAAMGDLPTDAPTPTNEDRIDELAYQMMRGNLGNGQARKDAASEMGFTAEETQAAQNIVNQKDWGALRDRHNEREANGVNAAMTASGTKEEPKPTPEEITSQWKQDIAYEDAYLTDYGESGSRADLITNQWGMDLLDKDLHMDYSQYDEPVTPTAGLTPEVPASEAPKPEEQKHKEPKPPVNPAYSDLRSDEGRAVAQEFAGSQAGYQEALSKVHKVRDQEIQDGWLIEGRYEAEETNSFEFKKRAQVIEKRRLDLAQQGLDWNTVARLQAEDEWSAGKLGSYYK